MKANVNIILGLTLLTGACSPASWLSKGDNDLNYTSEERSAGNEKLACQEYNVSPNDTIWFDDFLVVGSDTYFYEQVYPRFAFQEYGVTPLDTIWFDDFLVVGADTLDYHLVYPPFAFQEYGVTPLDTIWFDDFLVVGADTLGYEQFYNKRERKFSIMISPGPFGFYWSTRLRWFNPELYLQDEIFFGLGDAWNEPFISPQRTWIEIVGGSRDTRRPLYTYWMGLTPRVAVPEKAPVTQNDRERGVVFNIALFSAILVFLSL